jgi:hypothetical protein
LNGAVTRRVRVLVSIAIVILALSGIVGSHGLSGPEVLRITPDHGVHLLDVFVLALAVAGLLVCWWAEMPARDRERVDSRR